MNAHCYVTGFTKVFSKKIVLHKPISDTNIRVSYGEFKKLYIFDKDDVSHDVLNEYSYRFFQNVQRTEYAIPTTVRIYHVNPDYLLYPYLHFVSEEDMKQEPIKHILTNNYFVKGETTYKNAVIILKLERDLGTGEYSINYWINNRIIIKPPHKHGNTLVNLLIEDKMETMFTKNNKELSDMLQTNTSLQYVLLQTEQQNVKREPSVDVLLPNVNLYNYQKGDVDWIGNIERMVSENCNTITYSYSLAFPVLNDQFIIYNDKLSYGMSTEPFRLSKTFEFFGGNIISEVGLGKTLTMLYHIFKKRNATNDRYVEFGDTCNYFYKRGRCKGTSCQREVYEIDSLYCKEHSRTPFVDKRCTRYRNLDDFNLADYIMKIKEREYIRTRATLVICPNHLCDQWVQEYYSKFQATHRILLVVTSDQYSNLTFGDLLFADLVIISYNFLINKKFTDYVREYYVHCGYKDPMAVNYTNLREYFGNVLEANGEASDDKRVFTENLLHSKLTSFNLFYWERVVLDEVHEIQNMAGYELLQHTIKNFASTYKWNISGTPFPKGVDSFIHLMSYISSYTNGVELARNNRGNQMPEYFTTDYWISMGMDSGIIGDCESLFRRNTRESVASEYAGNILRDYVKLLEFTDQERAIYDSYKGGTRNNYYDFLIKLCCHAELNADTKEMIRNCKTFDEIRDCMLNYNRTLLEKEEVRVKNSQADIDYYTNELTLYREPYTEWEEQRVGELNVRLNVAKRQNTMYKKNYTDISRTYNYLLSSVENLVIAGEELICPICLDIIEPGSITITRCGHKFCWDCIYETHRVQASSSRSTDIKCPSCNTLMSHKELYLLKDTDKEDTPKSDLQSLIESTRSTKIGNIIHFLKTSLQEGDKVILFSQWDEILCKVGDILQRSGISIVYCSGTVYQRKRAITSFSKDSKINIILLSSRNAASGINLTVANKIILLEPIYGPREYRHNIESQAVGRADRLGQKRPIDIYRFIIKDTVEQDIYNNCIDDKRLRELRIE